MKVSSIIIVVALSICTSSTAQEMGKYDSLANLANEAYNRKEYKSAAFAFHAAFEELGGKGLQSDRYTAAKAWAMADEPDSAFFHLQRLADKTKFLESNKLLHEEEFRNLHQDARWASLLHQLNPNGEVFMESLIEQLQRIYDEDQGLRARAHEIEAQFGHESTQLKEHWKEVGRKDSMHVLEVTKLIETYGWLSVNQVGATGNKTIWLVIQHADIATQEKYFPVMKQAVNEGRALASELAYLEDRIRMRKGQKQIYGTQYKVDLKTGESTLWEVEDTEKLNERRRSVGLPDM